LVELWLEENGVPRGSIPSARLCKYFCCVFGRPELLPTKSQYQLQQHITTVPADESRFFRIFLNDLRQRVSLDFSDSKNDLLHQLVRVRHGFPSRGSYFGLQ